MRDYALPSAAASNRSPQPNTQRGSGDPSFNLGNSFLTDQLINGSEAPEEAQADAVAHAVVDWMWQGADDSGAPASMDEAFLALFGADIAGIPVVSGAGARQRADDAGAEAISQDDTVYLPEAQRAERDRHQAEVKAHEYAHVILGHVRPGAPLRRYAAYSHGSTLRRGDQGSAVSSLQDALVALGYMTAAEKATGPGIFGPRTESAVMAFQRAKGLTVDGIVGPKTGGALATATASSSSSSGSGSGSSSSTSSGTSFVYTTTLRRGDQGSAVSSLQDALVALGYMTAAEKATGPGIFGPRTESAVMAFQRAKGLTVDGIVGPQTGGALQGGGTGTSTGTGTGTGTSSGSGGSTETRQDVGDADPKNILGSSDLNPTVKSLTEKTVLALQARGYQPYIHEGFRSFERQNELYAQGRTKPGSKVTWVQGGGSWHNYGLAVDIVFWNSSHTGPTWDGSMPWSSVGQEGLAAGFTRSLASIGDYPHLEYHPKWGNTASDLVSTYYSGGLQAVWDKVE